jgi:hypothetical protein
MAAGFKAPVSRDIRSEIWVKLWGNLAFNPISALSHATLQDICRFPPTRELARRMMTEAKAVAEALGVVFRISLEQRLAGAEAVGAHKTSMLQDVEHGRTLELQALVGAVIELGRITGVPTPTIEAVHAATALLSRTLAAGGWRLRRRRPGAGLMAAEALAAGGAGVAVELFDALPSVGRKFLLAGRGGLNLTHSEPLEPFLGRYGWRAEPRCASAAGLRPRGAARLGVGAGHRHLRRHLGPRLSRRPQGRAAAARLAAPAARGRAWCSTCATAGGLGRGRRRTGLRQPGRRNAPPFRRHRAGAGRRQLAAAGLDGAWVPWLRRAASPWRRCSRRTAASTSTAPGQAGWSELPAQPLRRPAGQAGGGELHRRRWAGAAPAG